MNKRIQILVIEVIYDPDEDPTLITKSSPAEWDWQELIGETVAILAAGPDHDAESKAV